MRKVYLCSPDKERAMIETMGGRLLEAGYNASNSTLVAVSSDYSSIAWQVLRHKLSHDGEICEGFTIDVPYPDQSWNKTFADRALVACRDSLRRVGPGVENIILIEAGVIRGSNYRNVVELFSKHYAFLNIVTTTLFENDGSAFASNFVVEYYDDTTQDLTFWWETYNRHWQGAGKGDVT